MSNNLDNNAAPLPFNESAFLEITNKKKKLRIGYFEEMPNFPTTVSVKRAISIAKAKLEQEGYIVVPFKVSQEENEIANEIFVSCAAIGFFGQFNSMFTKHHENPIQLYAEFFLGYNLPDFMRKIIGVILSTFVSKRVANSLKCIKKYDSDEIDRVFRLKERFERDFSSRWEAEGLDAMICPAYFHSAFKATDSNNELAF